MGATTYNLMDNTPIQITDGESSAYIQEIKGVYTRFTCSSTQPNPTTVTHCVIMNGDLSVASGFKLWAWTVGEPIELSVLTPDT